MQTLNHFRRQKPAGWWNPFARAPGSWDLPIITLRKLIRFQYQLEDRFDHPKTEDESAFNEVEADMNGEPIQEQENTPIKRSDLQTLNGADSGMISL